MLIKKLRILNLIVLLLIVKKNFS